MSCFETIPQSNRSPRVSVYEPRFSRRTLGAWNCSDTSGLGKQPVASHSRQTQQQQLPQCQGQSCCQVQGYEDLNQVQGQQQLPLQEQKLQGQGQGMRDKGARGKSCQAIIQAVSSLYRLDDFVKEEIGHGFFSDVYKVTHKVTGDVMVLKMNTSSSNRPNVLREVQLMNKLQHPNILRLLGVCVHEGQLHALTEHVNMGSLEQILADKSLTLDWSLRLSLACDIARGMTYLHSRGFMHRDLTSKNILIQDRGSDKTELVAIVADLGLATKIPDPHGKQLPVVGSPWWMAPECIHGKRYGQKADVFSYGIILCEIIARIESDPDVLPRSKNFGLDYIAFSELVQTSNCPLDFLHMALTCCKFEPKERPSFSEAVDLLVEMMSRDLTTLAETGDVTCVDTQQTPTEDGEATKQSVQQQDANGDNQLPGDAGEADDSHQQMMQPVKRRMVRSESLATTPLAVGRRVSSTDRYYTYLPQTHNPFRDRFRHYTKLTGCSMENWMYWCNSTSPRAPSLSSSGDTLATPPPESPAADLESTLGPASLRDSVDEWDYVTWSMAPRGSYSLPGSPEIGQIESPFSNCKDATEYYQGGNDSHTCGQEDSYCSEREQPSSPGASDGVKHAEDVDAKSDVSADSALELDCLLHARRSARNKVKAASGGHRRSGMDHIAAGADVIESVFRHLDDIHYQHLANTDININDSNAQRLHGITRTISRFSESQQSTDDNDPPFLSPTSSFSSCCGGESPESSSGAGRGDFPPSTSTGLSLTRSQWEHLEQRKRQRERFLELVRRWEMKQPAPSSKMAAHVAGVHVAPRRHSTSSPAANLLLLPCDGRRRSSSNSNWSSIGISPRYSQRSASLTPSMLVTVSDVNSVGVEVERDISNGSIKDERSNTSTLTNQ